MKFAAPSSRWMLCAWGVMSLLGVSVPGARARTAFAQRPVDRAVGNLPRDVARDATALYNAAATKRVRGDFSLGVGDTVRGDLAVLEGNARIAGLVTGQLVVINGDATLLSGARVEGALTVLGGTFESPDRTPVSGEIRVWSARLRYREVADTLVVDSERELFARWSRWQRDAPNGSQSDFFITTAHTYNRVEGLPIYIGPRIRVRNGDTRVEAQFYGIFRTGESIDWTEDNLGHRIKLELRQGKNAGVFVGGRAFNEVDAIESWQLTDTEVGLSSFVVTRDYRDYWERHGAQGYLGAFGPGNSEVKIGFGEERWSARRARNVPSLFNSDAGWRVNPRVDEGVLRLLTVSGKLDTRNSEVDPRSGWLLRADVERGNGTLNRVGLSTIDTRSQSTGDIEYTRALVDFRRYNRLAPNAQLNLRAVGGAWLGGDALPMQRRFAVSGIDALPGFDFRQMIGDVDVGTCASGNPNVYAALGRPAQCERMFLLQAELKGDFRFGNVDSFGDRRWRAGKFSADGAWVLFANSGRGWLVNSNNSILAITGMPPVNTWRTDVGGGLDFGTLGVYFAKAVSQGHLPANVYVRLGRRF